MAAMNAQERLLNGVCPYYTMYPLAFPLMVLERHAKAGDWVLDPFCGRGTTNFAARLLGMPSVGIDSSPVAAALAGAKLATATPAEVTETVRGILRSKGTFDELPKGAFWKAAYHPKTLEELCILRHSLLQKCDTDSRILLRAIILGSLHGPLTKSEPSYLSNQCPRTFAPKPDYAVRFWKERHLRAPLVNVIDVVNRRANRYLSMLPKGIEGRVAQNDSRMRPPFGREKRFAAVVTSPPYYGMRTYVPDQWIRNWFVGGPGEVAYKCPKQVQHMSPDIFVSDLSKVWTNASAVCIKGAKLVIRFGAINARSQNPLDLIKKSIADTDWRIVTARPAGKASDGRRQSRQFATTAHDPIPEYDIYAVKAG